MNAKVISIDGVEGTWTPDQATTAPGYLSEHFREAEFDCNHCGKYGENIAHELIEVLEDVRHRFGPVVVNSGVRCKQHNSNVGGASNSRHLTNNADAADIVCPDASVKQVREYLLQKYHDKYGIGTYSSFVHIDTRPGGPARW
jgi:uncharacterized protein YcbK (DUF882 family)